MISDPIAWYADDLAAFVADGTYPEGKDILFASFPYMHSAVIQRVTATIQASLPVDIATTANYNGKTPTPPLTLSSTETPSENPVSEKPMESMEGPPKKNFGKATFAAIVAVLFGIAFLLLRRRLRP